MTPAARSAPVHQCALQCMLIVARLTNGRSLSSFQLKIQFSSVCTFASGLECAADHLEARLITGGHHAQQQQRQSHQHSIESGGGHCRAVY
jgi:hypothetical protein